MEEPFLIEHPAYGDHRGVFCASPLSEKHNWVQVNTSISTEKFTLRGLHFQIGEYAQKKYLKVISGRVFNIVLSIDPTFENYGTPYIFEIDKDHAVMVPRGYANGLITLEENTVIQYFVDNEYSANNERSILYSTVPEFKTLVDSLTDTVVISDKDRDGMSWERYSAKALQEMHLIELMRLDQEMGLYDIGTDKL